jgi:hypothetical protein
VYGTCGVSDSLFARASRLTSPYTEYHVAFTSEYNDGLEDNSIWVRLYVGSEKPDPPSIGWTLLGTYDTGVGEFNTVSAELRCVGTTISVKTGGTTRISVTNSAITGSGIFGHDGVASAAFENLSAGYTVDITAGSGGSVSTAQLTGVLETGDTKKVTVTPNSGYRISGVTASNATITPSVNSQTSATEFTVNATANGSLAFSFAATAPATPTIGTPTVDEYGGVTLPVTDSSASPATSLKVYRSLTSDGTYTELTGTSSARTNNGSGSWTVLDPRPDLADGWGKTYYYKIEAVNAYGTSAKSSAASAYATQNSGTVVANRAALVATQAKARNFSGYPQYVEPMTGSLVSSYKSWPLVPRAYAYYLDDDATLLTAIEAQWDYLNTFVSALGDVRQISDLYANNVNVDWHYRACWHSYTAAKLLELAGETTLSAEMLSTVDDWAAWYLANGQAINYTQNIHGVSRTVTYLASSSNNGSTWQALVDAPNQALWAALTLSVLYNDPDSDFYQDDRVITNRSGGTITLTNLIKSIITSVSYCQGDESYLPVGHIPWQYDSTDEHTGYHLAALISLLSIQAAFGHGWYSTLDDVIDLAFGYMAADGKFTDESDVDFEWNDERGAAYLATSDYTDPVPGLNYSWARHNYDDEHPGSSGIYQATDDYVTLAPGGFPAGTYLATDGLLSAHAYLAVLWGVPAATLALASQTATSATLHFGHTVPPGQTFTNIKVYRDTSPGFTPGVGNLLATITDEDQTTYADETVDPGTTYYYAVVLTTSSATATSNEIQVVIAEITRGRRYPSPVAGALVPGFPM